MKKYTISNIEQKKIRDFYMEFKNEPVLLEMLKTKHHRSSNTYKHCCNVTEACLVHAINRNLNYDYDSLTRGAMLHDLYLYDWRESKNLKKNHLTSHPEVAYQNARKYFDLNPLEKDIITNHMWPITLLHFPKSKEARLVCYMDKIITFKEIFAKKKKFLIFDLDGTLLDTLGDLESAVNFALRQFGYEEHTLEFVKNAIGNGVAKLIERSIPDGLNNPNYEECLSIFKKYYSEHYDVKTIPYPYMRETLIELRKRGYTLAVVTNKVHEIAVKLINKFYPGIFQYVQGDTKELKKKPSPDMVKFVMKKLKIKNRHRVIYIGDTNVDYETAANMKVQSILVSYGYRSKSQLLELESKEIIIDSPIELLDVFKLKEDEKSPLFY